MLSDFMAIFGAIGGGALRLVPVAITAYRSRKASENEIELARIDLEKTRAEAAAVVPHEYVTPETVAPLLQPSRPHWTEALNLLVRPTITLWLLVLYTIYKIDLIAIAIFQDTPFVDMAGVIWNDDDIAIFSGTMTFWFVDQALAEPRSTRR
jgi:hypothetical protein